MGDYKGNAAEIRSGQTMRMGSTGCHEIIEWVEKYEKAADLYA